MAIRNLFSRWFRRQPRRAAPRARPTYRRPRLEELETRRLLSAGFAGSAIPISVADSTPRLGVIGQAPTYYAFTVTDSGLLTAQVAPTAGTTRLSLLSSDGTVLMQSDGQNASNPDDLIDLHLAASTTGTTYYLEVQGLGNSTGNYVLIANYTSAIAPNQPLPAGQNPESVAVADFNGDGILDLAVANYYTGMGTVYLGTGDGTFTAAPTQFQTGIGVNGIVAGDFSGDGKMDLATVNYYTGTISLLKGNGDGTFGAAVMYAAGAGPIALAAGDFTGNGELDLVVADNGSNSISLLLNNGDGTFAAPLSFAVGASPDALVTGDFNGDGRLDVAVANYGSNNVSLLFGNGNGTFAPQTTVAVGQQPSALASGDFNGDGKLDLAVANAGTNNVSVLSNNGEGTFTPQTTLTAGSGPSAIVAADFNGDGRTDLAVANFTDGTISLFLGEGHGAFASPTTISAGESPAALVAADFNRDGALDLAVTQLTPGTVSVLLGNGDGTFRTQSLVSSGVAPIDVVSADFTGNGLLDLAVANYGNDTVTIFLGQGDGTFHFGGVYPVGGDPYTLIAADVNGDGILDLITANLLGGSVSVLLGRGDGTFAPPIVVPTGPQCFAVVADDFNGDGKIDLAATSASTNQVLVLLGHGDGTFAPAVHYTVGQEPKGLAAGDFTNDGHLDLAVADFGDATVSILLGRADGTFVPGSDLTAGSSPSRISIADFNNDGNEDLAVSNVHSNDVSIFLGDGKGGFTLASTIATAPGPYRVLVGDFNHDGIEDLAITSVYSSDLTIELGRGDGTFQQGQVMVVGESPGAVLGDFNGDGNLDIVALDRTGSDFATFLGQGNGTLLPALMMAVPGGPVAIATADFNDDGNLDLVTANPTTGSIAISLGNGDGTFQAPITDLVGGEPVAVTVGDFNNDGRPDLAVVNYSTNTVSVWLGIGDGTFESPVSYAVGSHPDAVLVGDFTGDGILDLAVANYASGTVTILMGRGDGTFLVGQQIAVGSGPVSLALGDSNGTTDLIVANSLSRTLSILEGAGNGTFRLMRTVALGFVPSAVVAGDFNGAGRLDIATTDQADNSVSVLLANSDGTFDAPVSYAVGTAPVALVVGDFSGDGLLDLATANNNSDDVTVLLGQGDGTFRAQAPVAVGTYPLALVAGDFNNDGHLDFATANGLDTSASVGLGLGNGAFVDAALGAHPIRSTPLVGDLTGGGLPDVAILAENGQILVRLADPGAPGAFDPPVVLNPNPADSVRDLTLVTVNRRQELAALSARDNVVWFYTYAGNSQFVRTQGPALQPGLPVQIVAGDLTGDGRQDLVVTSSGPSFGEIAVYLQQPDGVFGPASYEDRVGVSPSDVTLANLSGGPGPDIVVTDQDTGEIYVLQNTGPVPFSTQLVFPAGTGLYEANLAGSTSAVQSDEAPLALTAIPTAGGAPVLIALNQGSDRFDLLAGDGQGGLFNPVTSPTSSAGATPSAIVSGDFNGDGVPDLAVLDTSSDQVLIYLGDGKGGFIPDFATGPDGEPLGISAGNAPSGLAVADLAGNGRLDLLIGNAQGDILQFQGNGDGTFAPYQRLDSAVALAVSGLSSTGQPVFAFTDKSLDQIAVQSGPAGPSFQQGRQNGIRDPGAIRFADLTGNGIQDLIVANSGSNDVLVYLGLGNGQFGPAHTFFVGTDPVSITVADLTGNGILDLVVANKGSNDVSILFGQGQGANWTLVPGPRLRAGIGPVATVVQDINGLPDILVANSGSNDVYLLPGVGQGFFNDKAPVIFQTGVDPVQLFVCHFDNQPGLDLVTVNAGSNDLTFFPDFGPGRSVSLGNIDPVAAFAGDFNQDGTSDLIVAGRNGQFALVASSATGPVVTTLLPSSGLANISDMVLGEVTGNIVTAYATVDGLQEAIPLTFVLDQVLPSGGSPAEPTAAETVSRQATEFSSPSEAPGPEIVATLTLALHESVVPAAGLVTSANVVPAPLPEQSGEGAEEPVEAVAVAPVEESNAVERNAAIAGADHAPLRQYLNGPESDDSPALTVPFPSPLQLLDSSDPGPVPDRPAVLVQPPETPAAPTSTEAGAAEDVKAADEPLSLRHLSVLVLSLFTAFLVEERRTTRKGAPEHG